MEVAGVENKHVPWSPKVLTKSEASDDDWSECSYMCQ